VDRRVAEDAPDEVLLQDDALVVAVMLSGVVSRPRATARKATA